MYQNLSEYEIKELRKHLLLNLTILTHLIKFSGQYPDFSHLK